MGTIKQEIKFPCGYEEKISISGWTLLGEVDFEFKVCPIHKDKCKESVK